MRHPGFAAARNCCLVACVCFVLLLAGGSIATAQTIELELMVNSWGYPVIEAIERSVQRFEALYPEYRVTVFRQLNWDDYIVRTVAGVPPDVVTTGSNVGAWAENNLVLPLDSFITDELRDAIVAPMWENVTWLGHVYGVPSIEQGPRLGLVWNAAFLADAGIEINPDEVLTWYAFFDIADKLTVVDAERNVRRIGYDPRNGQNSRLFTVAPLWGVYDYLPFPGEPRLNHPGLVEMLETNANRVYRKYPQWTGSTRWYDIALLQNVAVTNLGVYAPGEVRNYNPDIEIVVSWPPENNGKKVQQLSGWALSIPYGAKNPEASFKLIEFLATDLELQLELFHAVGFLGGLKELYRRLAQEVQDPSVLWYLRSVDQAEYIDAIRPDPFLHVAESLFGQARELVYLHRHPAQTVLDDIQRQLVAQLNEAGRL